MFLQIVGHVGPSLPISIRDARKRANEHMGKADPIWDTAFALKFTKKNVPDANVEQPLKTPMGAAKVIEAFESRIAEINWLETTQHLELATTLAEMRANSISGFSVTEAVEEDDDAADIAEAHLGIVPLRPDPTYIAAMKRKIEHERYLYGCSGVHKTQFVLTKTGDVGIAYDGPDSKDADKRLGHMRAFKARWIERFGALPTKDELFDAMTFAAWYGKPVLASMTEDEYKAHHESKRLAYKDDEEKPREAFHADPLGPRPAWADYDTENEDPQIAQDERDQYKADTEEWKAASKDLGYAGPSGILGLDDE